MDDERYKPIEDYALVGDCQGAALVARNGDIDWCTLGRFDADPILFPALDAQQGGRWSITVDGATTTRSYEPRSNVLRTVHDGPRGTVEVLDFMAVGRREGSSTYDYVTLTAPGWLMRRVTVLNGEADVVMTFRPAAPDWGRGETRAEMVGDEEVRFVRGMALYADRDGLTLKGDTVRWDRAMTTGDSVCFTLAAKHEHANPCARVGEALNVARAFWSEWAEFCRYSGPHEEQVLRSALTLKMLTYSPTGALVAAATTSLPEHIGGHRNWDYRYCWVRDSALTLYGLSAIGYSGEAEDFAGFLMNLPLPRFTPLQIMYGIHYEHELHEENLEHLEGYRGSKPVRVGNGAHDQVQIDIYGELLDLALVRQRLGWEPNDHMRMFLEDTADTVVDIWDKPDAGLWEARNEPQHYGHSKMMAWVALDRAIAVLGERPAWVEAREKVMASLRHAAEEVGHLGRIVPFREADGTTRPAGKGSDAALLLTPAHGVPLAPDVLDRTVRAVEAELRHDDFLHRYKGEDGLEGEEGAFLICSFWLVDALLATGRGEEAEAMFDRLCTLGNDVGIFAEEADPETGAHLGNTPQAFTHLALIASAVNLQLWREGGGEAVKGTYADRAGRAIGATEGLRGLWETWKQTGRPVRFTNSKDSVLRV